MLRESDYPELRRRLLQGGIRKSRAARLLRELDDHRLALHEVALCRGGEPADAELFAAQALGDREIVLAAMLAQPELRSLAHRRAWLVYGLLPSGALIAVTVLALLATWIAVNEIGADPGWLRSAIDCVFMFVSHGMLWLLVLGPLWHARRSEVAPSWPALGALATIGLGSALSLQMAWPVTEGHYAFLDVRYDYGRREGLMAVAMASLLVLPYIIGGRCGSWRTREQGS